MPFYIYDRYEDSIFSGLFVIKLEVRFQWGERKRMPGQQHMDERSMLINTSISEGRPRKRQ
jgi:hypothetical protein